MPAPATPAADRGARTLRGAGASIVAVGVAALSHTFAGAQLPTLAGTALAFAFAVPLCVLLAGRAWSSPRLLAAVSVSQAALHSLFGFGAGPDRPATSGHHHRLVLLPPPEVAPPATVDTSMLWWHAAAAVVTTVLLCVGVRATRVLAAAAGGYRLRRWLLSPTPTSPPARDRAVIPPTARVLPRLVVLAPSRRRGPPLLFAA